MHRKIEIKLRLAGKEAHAKLAACLEKDLKATHHQENFFFDGANQEITSTRTVLRCRFYNTDQRALLTCKARHLLLYECSEQCTEKRLTRAQLCRASRSLWAAWAGAASWRRTSTLPRAASCWRTPRSSSAWASTLSTSSKSAASACLASLACTEAAGTVWRMLSHQVHACWSSSKLPACRRLKVQKLVCLGGFKNLRRDYAWEGFKLELDETHFDWGTVYEVEVETVRFLAGCTKRS